MNSLLTVNRTIEIGFQTDIIKNHLLIIKHFYVLIADFYDKLYDFNMLFFSLFTFKF